MVIGKNDVSISQKLESINQNTEFGHWEMNWVMANNKSNVNLLTLYKKEIKN